MSDAGLSRRKTISFGWAAMKENLPLISVLIVGIVLLDIIAKASHSFFVIVLLGLVKILFAVCFNFGITKIAVKTAKGEQAAFQDFMPTDPLFLRYLGAHILTLIIVLSGLILLIVPGIIWGLMFMFYGFLVLDKGYGAVDALKKSKMLTDGFKGELFIFNLIFFGVALLVYLVVGTVTSFLPAYVKDILPTALMYFATALFILSLSWYYRQRMDEDALIGPEIIDA